MAIGWLAVLFPLTMVSLYLLVRGLRGVRVDDHPLCRKCHFDLTGQPPDSNLCPECGSNVSQPTARVTGHRRRRTGHLVTGSVLMLLCLASYTAIGVAYVQVTGVQAKKPVWWLKHEAVQTATAKAAVVELDRRQRAGLLTAAQTDAVADLALAHQADPSQPWIPEWGDFVDGAQAAGKLDAKRLAKYAEQGLQPDQLVVRKQVRRGDGVPVRLVMTGDRVGQSAKLTASIQSDTTGDLVAPNKWGRGTNSHTLQPNLGGSTGYTIALDPEKVAKAADGPHELRLTVKAEIKASNAPPGAPPLATRAYELTGTFDLVPADAETVKVINDPAAADAMRQALSVQSLREEQWSKDNYSIGINCKPIPHPVAFDVMLRDPATKKEWRLGRINFNANTNSGYHTGGEAKGFRGDKADIILRSSLVAARDTVHMASMWEGEVVFPDVAITRIKPATTTSAK